MRFALIKASAKDITNKFIQWQEPLVAINDNRLEKDTYQFSLQEGLQKLAPLTDVETLRYLFFSTVTDWTAMFSNKLLGLDQGAPKVLCRLLQTDLVIIHFNFKTSETMFSLYSHTSGKFTLVRSVCLIKGSSWTFTQQGTPLEFEPELPNKIVEIKKKINLSYLKLFFDNMGICPFQIDFYDSNKYSFLVSKQGPKLDNIREHTVEEANSLLSPK